MNRKMDELGRVTIPIEMRQALGIEPKDELKIYLSDDNIVLSKVKRIKTKNEIEEKLHNLKELVELDFEDENLNGSISALEWVLNTERTGTEYLNDYDDLKETEAEEVK